MLNRWERWILFYDFILKSSPAEAGDIPLEGMISLLENRFEKGESVKLISNDTAAIRIQDMSIDSGTNTVAFLINYADTEATDPVFADLETGKLRLEPKLDGEGVALSAHMVVSTSPSQTGVYRAVLEDIPSVGKTKIVPFLASEFRSVSTYVFDDSEGRPRKCRPLPDMLGHASQTLRDDLREGKLSQIELVSIEGDPTEMDEEGRLELKSKTISFKVKSDTVGEAAVRLINEVRRKGQKIGYPEVRVRFKKNEGRQRTVLVGSLREDAGEVVYNRVEMFSNFESPMEQSTDKLRLDMVEKLINLVVEVRGKS